VRILVLSPYLPHRHIGHGGGIAVRGLLTYLARRHEVTLAALVRSGEHDTISEVTELGVEVVPYPFADRQSRGLARTRLAAARAWALGRSVGSGYPYYVEKYWSRSLSRQIQSTVAALSPDAIQIEYLQLALYCRDLCHWRESRTQQSSHLPRPRLVLNSHELGSLPRRRRATAARSVWHRIPLLLEARAWERLQVEATHWADTTLCVTDQDRTLLEGMGGQRCQSVPLGMDTEAIQPVWQASGSAKLLFVGSFNHGPNRTAAQFLVDKVWPVVSQYQRSTRLILAGRGSRAFLREQGSTPPGIEALGYVDDLQTQYSECRLFVAPLAEGGGIKIKILEAMAHGIPVVTTPIGAEGIVEPSDEALWIAAPDTTFAAVIQKALQEPEECQHRSEKARRLIEQNFSWSTITERLTSIYAGDE
jgi:glycosyltransferase involved in cell wall biosynthesis